MLLVLFVVGHPGLHLFPVVGVPVPVEGKSYEPPKKCYFQNLLEDDTKQRS